MNESHPREEAIFEAALQLPPEQRAAHLRAACDGDTQLLQSVEKLLAAHERTDSLLEATPAAETGATIKLSFPTEEKSGDRIGRYKLLQQIGEGGCGSVYMAEQEEPVRRRVAVKVIKLGMDTKQVIGRFEAERQALAMMDHPNIAKVLDAGATETGRPFFVMELVRGIRITDYCDQNKLPTRERLHLFIQVCNAIQHAHQKGIIHRDIKPSNILVTLHDGVPVPKVIDFGIAKATQGRLTDQTLFTAFEQFIGTPAYMSPEQAEMSGLDIDTRCDVYALGVLLYELLTGRTPFDPKELIQSGLDELRRTIREREPERPSTRLITMLQADLTSVAQRRQSDAPKLVTLLRGDLDWIVMKALEKDRTRRYETANGFAMDVQRYLNNEPVLASPPSNIYRFQKLVRRNQTAFAAVGAGCVALVIGCVVCLYLFIQERALLKRALAAEADEAALRVKAEDAADQLRRHAEASEKIGRAGYLLTQEKYDEVEQIIKDVPPRSTMLPFYNLLGRVDARASQWPAALTHYMRVAEYDATNYVGYFYLAPLLVRVGDTEGYRRNREQMLRRFAATTDPVVAERVAKACLILPPATAELDAIVKMVKVAVAAGPGHASWGYFEFTKALAEYRSGNFAAAAEWAQKVVALGDDEWNRVGGAAMVLAMAQCRLHLINEARSSLIKGRQIFETKMKRADHDLHDDWNDWVIAYALRREAEALPELQNVTAADLEPDWVAPLHAAGLKFTVQPMTGDAWELDLDDQPIDDLVILRGAPLGRLSLMHTRVGDLGPLRGMPMRWLRITDTRVTDLAPLRGMKMETLHLAKTKITDLTPLRGMPLKILNLADCPELTNLEPLAGMTDLQMLVLPPKAKDVEFLRHFPRLERLSYKYDSATKAPDRSAAEFWIEYDKTARP